MWRRCRVYCHRGVQLILSYSWARPAILVAGKGRGGMFLFLHFHSCPSLLSFFHLLYYVFYLFSLSMGDGGWVGMAKVSYVLFHWVVQLILACSWARLTILVAGKGRGGMFLFLLFLYFHSCFFPVLISSTISSVSFLPFSGRWHKMTHKGWHVIKPEHNKKTNRK